jgi:hypothetical protein
MDHSPQQSQGSVSEVFRVFRTGLDLFRGADRLESSAMGCRIVGGRGRSCPWLGDVRRFRKTIGLTLSNPRWHDAELCRAAPPLAGEIQAQRHQSEFLHSLPRNAPRRVRVRTGFP